MKQQIKHRYSDKVIFECELDDGTINPMREAVIQAVNSNASLNGASLNGASLNGIKGDFWMILLSAPFEVSGLRLALIEGRVDGSTYQGDCACLVGTIANVRHENYQEIGIKPDSNRAAERWFMGIQKGDTPETNQISKITVEWLDKFVAKLNFANNKAV